MKYKIFCTPYTYEVEKQRGRQRDRERERATEKKERQKVERTHQFPFECVTITRFFSRSHLYAVRLARFSL